MSESVHQERKPPDFHPHQPTRLSIGPAMAFLTIRNLRMAGEDAREARPHSRGYSWFAYRTIVQS